MDRQQQHIQLARTSRGAPAANVTPPMQPQHDGARLTSMCNFLHLAVYKGLKVEVMAQLPEQHAAATDSQATGAFIVNLQEKEFEVSETGILKHGQCNIHEVTAGRNTVLHVAAERGHHELIQELYLRFRDQGVLSRRNSALDTPLHCAARAGHVSAVTILAQVARDCGESTLLGWKNEAGDTALHLAARHGHGAAVEVLVSEAAESAAELNNAGVSALYLAVISRSEQAVRAIMACRDVSSAGPSSQNALHAAVFQSSEMVSLLLNWRPALVDQVDCNGSSPVHFAASDGDSTIVQAILRATPPRTLYKKDSAGLSALHVAARMDHSAIVADMVNSCLDAAELRDDNGRTFVHTAAREKRSKVVSLATSNPFLHGLLDTQDKDGNTPLHLAVAAGAPGVVEELLRKGKVRADVLNNDGHTAFDLAVGSTNFFTLVSLVVTLVAYGATLGPQRQDHLNRWSGSDTARQGIEKTSDSLAVVAVLIATSALAAGFNLPGGYSDSTGKAILSRKVTFKCFLFLDALAVATSVVVVVLLVYGKASRSAGSWKSFVVALHCMWVSLVSLLLAFYAALAAVLSSKAGYFYLQLAIYFVISFLSQFIVKWIGPDTTLRTVWRFLCQHKRLKGQRHAIRRQYPLARTIVCNLILFEFTSFLAIVGLIFIFGVSQWER
ncbi:hypothetical protein SETIT_5G043400v2 [Setaria italica]|uniref:PGG domain-containing protein n=2 Tax=Setaria italica TaxID=4555 RepID=A0A368R1J2_SETIT|nr:uncharacterized protein LOC101782978 [Setaria italica]RCV23918.1 hypothetical protein SETIT_5G043400v2 [Setaria italica]